MYTVAVKNLLTFEAVRQHEELLAEGMLEVFERYMGNAMFVSHQWLSEHHPDPNGEQLKILQRALKNLFSGASRISTAVGREILFGRASVPSPADLRAQPLYVWYDYFSCPQGSSLEDKASQLDAIHSIPSYVAKSVYFIILAPALKHESNQLLCHSTWQERGWCRVERMARELSPTNGFVILVEGAEHQMLLTEMSGFSSSPGEGRFSFQQDLDKVGSIVVQLLWDRLHHYLEQGDLHNYRFTLNQQAVWLRGLDIPPIDRIVPGFSTEVDPLTDPHAHVLAQFMHQNGFESITKKDEAGWSPLCYAAISGSTSLVMSLLNLRADPNDRIRKAKSVALLPKNMSVLSLACCFKNNGGLAQILAAKADVNNTDDRSQTALHWACAANNTEAIKALFQAGIDHRRTSFPIATAFQLACAEGCVQAIEELLSQTPQSLKQSLHFTFMLGKGSGEVVSLLINARADVNEQLAIHVTEHFAWWTLIKYFSLKHRRTPSRLTSLAYHHHGATPLMFSIICGNSEATYTLMKAGARIDIRNGRGKSAADLSAELQAPPSLTRALSFQSNDGESDNSEESDLVEVYIH